MKRFAFRVIALVLVLVASEGLFLVTYLVHARRALSFGDLQRERDALTGRPAQGADVKQLIGQLGVKDVRPAEQIGAEVLHPYLGFVYSPAQDDGAFRAAYGMGISRWGFLDDKDPIQKGASNRLIVGIFGGSVAWYLSSESAAALVRGLRASPAFRDKEIVIVRAALFGYKQPQQLLALTYLLSMGAHFDIVINLDGFNEVVLPITENLPKHVFPFYPRTWFIRAADSPSAREVVAQVTALRQQRWSLADVASTAVLRHSVTVNVAWKMFDEYLANSINRRQLDWLRQESSDGNYAGTGPFTAYADDTHLYADLAEKWKDASLQMSRLAQANGIAYFHFLQPNQYVEGSKVMSPEERAIAIDEDVVFAAPARAGYPLLVDAGKDLRKEGVRFHDLTRMFSTVAVPVYRDNCCHLDRRGGDMLAFAIAAAIVGGA
jgi:hypothetical protein